MQIESWTQLIKILMFAFIGYAIAIHTTWQDGLASSFVLILVTRAIIFAGKGLKP